MPSGGWGRERFRRPRDHGKREEIYLAMGVGPRSQTRGCRLGWEGDNLKGEIER